MNDLNKLKGRRQYLVTYSQCNLEKFPTRESFGEMVEAEFNVGTSLAKVSHWACCRETHQDGGSHYHCALKLTSVKKWVSVKERIQKNHNISVHFSDSHDYYLSAYRYLCKEDEDVAHSADHPNLTDAKSPATKKSILANKRKSSTTTNTPAAAGTTNTGGKAKKRLRLSNQDTAMFVRNNNIKNYTALLSAAEERRKEGLNDLSDFVFNRPEKHIRELIDKSWKMAEAPEKSLQEKRDRMDILIKFKNESQCVCGGEWLVCAKEVLSLNDIPELEFRTAVHKSLRLGRGKFRNVIAVGPSNCGKTFMFKPLTNIYGDDVFENPANHKFGWVGADKATIIMLQDFRWSKDLVTWKDLLLLLEGEKVKFPAPRNLFKDDVCISGNVAIFATSKSEIKFKGTYNSTDNQEDEMMRSRWRVFNFAHVFKEKDQKQVEACGVCFANFILG